MWSRLAPGREDDGAWDNPMGSETGVAVAEPQVEAGFEDWDEDRRTEIKALIAQLQDRLSFPPEGVPKQYLRERQAGNPLAYTPSMTPEELAARKALLLRQAHAVMAQEAAQQQYAPRPYRVPRDDEYLREPGEDDDAAD